MRDLICPRILIVGRVAWTANESTLPGIFNGFPSDRLAYICIETRQPDLSKCGSHFQISETAMLRRLFKWNTKTGQAVTVTDSVINKTNERQEQAILSRVRAHRSVSYLYMRELLWLIGGWKTRALKEFVSEFQPDVVFCVGDPLPLMNRLQRYVLKKAKVPGAIFIMDDIYSSSNRKKLSHRFYRWLLRQEVRPLIKLCSAHFAISPKMKQEYDELFGIDCEILTKGIEHHELPLDSVHSPIALVYTGNLLYGRKKTLETIAKTIAKINEEGDNVAFLNIYTQTVVPEEQRDLLEIGGASKLYGPVTYSELPSIYNDSDIVLFVESLDERYKHVARLSFSTKLTDYMASGRCIFAVGASDIAPIEYLRESNMAMTCSSENEIEDKLKQLLANSEKITEYAHAAAKQGIEYHDARLMHERLYNALVSIICK